MPNITQKQLEDFKNLFPEDKDIQALTLPEVLQNTAGKTVNWNTLTFDQQDLESQAVKLDECQMALGWIIFDAVCLAVGGVGLRASARPQTVQAMAAAAVPVLSKIEVIVAEMTAQGATITDRAWGVFSILKTIYNGGCLGAVISAFTNSLSWWNMILYGIAATATIIAALATDGTAFVVEIVILLANFGFLVSDIANAMQKCNLTPAPAPSPYPPTPAPAPGPYPGAPRIAIKTSSGNYVTAVNGGGCAGPYDVPIETNRIVVGSWERFTLIWLDDAQLTFALRTDSGNYVTAVNGGGIGGLNDASCPIQTDRTAVGGWEIFMLEMQPNGTYAIATSSGNYLTAKWGGGWNAPGNNSPVRTNATQIGPWEKFSLVRQ